MNNQEYYIIENKIVNINIKDILNKVINNNLNEIKDIQIIEILKDKIKLLNNIENYIKQNNYLNEFEEFVFFEDKTLDNIQNLIYNNYINKKYNIEILIIISKKITLNDINTYYFKTFQNIEKDYIFKSFLLKENNFQKNNFQEIFSIKIELHKFELKILNKEIEKFFEKNLFEEEYSIIENQILIETDDLWINKYYKFLNKIIKKIYNNRLSKEELNNKIKNYKETLLKEYNKDIHIDNIVNNINSNNFKFKNKVEWFKKVLLENLNTKIIIIKLFEPLQQDNFLKKLNFKEIISDLKEYQNFEKELQEIKKKLENDFNHYYFILDFTKFFSYQMNLALKKANEKDDVIINPYLLLYEEFFKITPFIFKYDELVTLNNNIIKQKLQNIEGFDNLSIKTKELLKKLSLKMNFEILENLLNKFINNEKILLKILKEYINNKNIYLTDNIYNLNYLNINIENFSLEELINELKKEPKAKMIFYGLSGTGKSAFGNYIANNLNQEFIYKRISDIQSIWVGQTTKNIAQMFLEAKSKNAILMIDEVEFLLENRNHSTDKNLDIINEMLIQIEQFNGILIFTTNLIDNIDPAFIRRFDLKIKFNPLNKKQTIELFKEYCKKMDIKYNQYDLENIGKISNATVGDFANIYNQQRFSKINNGQDFIKRLKKELLLKFDTKEIGFLN